MQRAKTGRKRLFRAALAIAEMTAEQWAAKEDVSQEHLSRVLNGKQVGSMVLLAKIDDFTQKRLNKRSALAG